MWVRPFHHPARFPISPTQMETRQALNVLKCRSEQVVNGLCVESRPSGTLASPNESTRLCSFSRVEHVDLHTSRGKTDPELPFELHLLFLIQFSAHLLLFGRLLFSLPQRLIIKAAAGVDLTGCPVFGRNPCW